REERADERDVAEDPGLVLDEHDVGFLARDELQLAVQIGRVEVPNAHEGDLMAALAEPVGDRERVMVDPAALIAREDHDALRPGCGQIPAGRGEREAEPTRDLLARELFDAAPPFLDEILPQRSVAHDAL